MYHAHIFMLPFIMILNLTLFSTFRTYSLAYTCMSHISLIVIRVPPSNYTLTSLKLFSISVIHAITHNGYISFGAIHRLLNTVQVSSLLLHNKSERWLKWGGEVSLKIAISAFQIPQPSPHPLCLIPTPAPKAWQAHFTPMGTEDSFLQEWN